MGGWGGWFKDGDGECNEKVEKHSDGSKDTHYMRTEGGDKSNHSHVMVRENSDGSKTAHGFHGSSKASKK